MSRNDTGSMLKLRDVESSVSMCVICAPCKSICSAPLSVSVFTQHLITAMDVKHISYVRTTQCSEIPFVFYMFY